MKYFGEYRDVLDASDAEAAIARVLDSGGSSLSFGHLDDRRFETLVYRIKCSEQASLNGRVTLMPGIGERGRDIVVYSSEGELRTIVQCKLLQDRITAPAVLRELLKLSIHSFLDPTVLPSSGITYELWCPGDFSEPAATLIDSWPSGWSEDELRVPAEELLSKYAAFGELTWDALRASILEFPSIVNVRKYNGIDISQIIRSFPKIFDEFFIGKIVMTQDDVRRAFREWDDEKQSRQPKPTTPRGVPEFFRPPPAPATFTGRADIVSTARRVMNEGKIAIISGAGGIGKSSIAAFLLEEEHSRTKYWLDGANLKQQLTMLAFALGVELNQLQAALDAKRAIIAVDNLMFDPAIRSLPLPGESIRILITSRERGLTTILPHSQLVDVPTLAPDAARMYLRLQVGLPFPWSDEDVDRACTYCGHFPLALKLLAASLQKQMTTCDALLKELRASPLATLDEHAQPNEATIATTFALALARLSSIERDVLIGLSVCGKFTWVDVVAHASGHPVKVTEQTLSGLHDVSLVERNKDMPLWNMHDVIRFLCAREPAYVEFAWRHDASALSIVASHQAPSDWALIEANLREILIAIERQIECGMGPEVGEIVRLLIPHLRERGHGEGRRDLSESLCLQVLPHLPEVSMLRACLKGHLGFCAYENGDRVRADALLQESLAMYRSMGSKSGEMATLSNMAHLDENDGNFDRAASRHREAAEAFAKPDLGSAEEPEWLRWEMTARINLVRCEARLGHFQVALDEADKILAASKVPELADIHARALAYKMKIFGELDRVDEALAIGPSAINELREAGLVQPLVSHLLDYAVLALRAGNPESVLQATGYVVDIAKRTEDWKSLARAHNYRAWAHLLLEDKSQALGELQAAWALANVAALDEDALRTLERLQKEIQEL
jgi:tetratricopeptide (TPR) repeat protein